MITILNRSIAFLAVAIVIAVTSAVVAFWSGATPAVLATITALGGTLIGSAVSAVTLCIIERGHQQSDMRMSTLIRERREQREDREHRAAVPHFTPYRQWEHTPANDTHVEMAA